MASKKDTNCFPDTFIVTFIELSTMTMTNFLVFLLMYFIIWPNKNYNDIFNHGYSIWKGWSCNNNDINIQSGYITFIGSQISGFCLYTTSLIFCYLDYYLSKNGKLQNYKFRYPPPRPLQKKISWRLYRKSILLARINTFCSLITVPIIFIPLMKWRGNCDNLLFDHENDRNHVSLYYDISLLSIRLILCPFVSDIIFYITHRGCHEINFLYKNVHKIHHEFVDTYGISATAAHPFEHLFCNLLTAMGAPIICGLPLIWFYIFICFGCIQTTIAHSGFDCKPFGKSKFLSDVQHDFHHHYQDCQYSGICDKIFKTSIKDIHPNAWKRMNK